MTLSLTWLKNYCLKSNLFPPALIGGGDYRKVPMNFLSKLALGILAKLGAYLLGLYQNYKHKMAVRAEVKKVQENLKNAKTPEEQEAAAAELIRITTPID